MGRYDDIIGLARPVSKKHPPMSRSQRAAQFSPFAALTGYDSMIDETGRETLDKFEIDEDSLNRVNSELVYLSEHKGETVDIVYFVEDILKSGGSYRNERIKVRKVDRDNMIRVSDKGLKIGFEDILSITRRNENE